MTDELVETLKRIRYDCTAIQGRVTDALKMIGESQRSYRSARPQCPACSLEVAGPKALAEHMENVHGQYESERPRA